MSDITPTRRSIRKYYEHVSALRAQGVLNEMSVRSPFESLLQETARLKDWTFIAELSGKSGGARIRPDGTLRDRNSLPRGYWERTAPLSSLSPKGASNHSPAPKGRAITAQANGLGLQIVSRPSPEGAG